MCRPDEFRCNNLRCIPTDHVCDGENDCYDSSGDYGDSSDEQNCSQYMSSSVAGNKLVRYGAVWHTA